MLFTLLLHSSEALALVLLLAVLLRIPLPALLRWGAAALGLVVFTAAPIIDPPEGNDVRIFWNAGVAVWHGEDPYAGGLVLNPPSTLPLFALLATLPFPALVWCWTAFNMAGTCALVFLGWQVLRRQEPQGGGMLEPSTLAVLTAVVALSFSSRYGLALGQLSVFTTLALYGALLAQGDRRPALAGVGLALGAVKPGTMLPFLLLFLRKLDVRAWLTAGMLGVVFCLVATGPFRLAESCARCLANIRAQGQPGGVNDYSYANASTAEIIAPDHAIYRLGVHDPRLIQAAQLATLLLLGVWVGWLVTSRLGRAAACALVCCYSALFLYHRIYDMIILTIPLVYCTSRALSEQRTARWLHVYCALAVLGVLYFRVGLIRNLTTYAAAGRGITAYLVQAIVLPYPVWLLLSVMACIPLAESRRARKTQDSRQ